MVMITVSMNVCVIDTRPWRTGWLVFAAAAAIAADPMPDSFEKMPRATPIWITMMMADPANPPTAAPPVKASAKISPSAAGRSPTFTMRMYSAAAT